VNLDDLHCLIDDDEAFLSEVTKRLSALNEYVQEHAEKMGLDAETRKFTPESEEALRDAFAALDTDNSGTLSWQEIDKGVRRAATKEIHIDMIALSNTVGIMAAMDHGEEINEDHFVSMLEKKARSEVGPSSGVLHLIYRHMKRIDTCMGLSDYAVDKFKSNGRFTELLSSRNIDTQLVDQDDDGVMTKQLNKIPLFGGLAGGLAKGMMKHAENLELPTLNIYRVFADRCKEIAYSHSFSNCIALCIIVVGGVEAATTYHKEVPADLEMVNYVLLLIFTIEMLLKVFAEGSLLIATNSSPYSLLTLSLL
jgi:hypothetical protein